MRELSLGPGPAPWRTLAALALAASLAGPVAAQEVRILAATPLECAAIEGMLVFGLVEGDMGEDHRRLVGMTFDGNGEACAAELEARGLGAGLQDPTCRKAMDLLAIHGPHPLMATPPRLLLDAILRGDVEGACDNLLSVHAPG